MARQLAITDLEDFLLGTAPSPVVCGRGVEIGTGKVVPELNFTLPTMGIDSGSWPDARRQYEEMISSALQRAVELHASSVVVEFETLPAMTLNPDWELEITRLLSGHLRECHEKHGLNTALRFTPNDTREFDRPPLRRRGRHWDDMRRMFAQAADNGADLISIESTGGKEISTALS